MAVATAVDWTRYATQYDKMTSLNPAYDELIEEVRRIFTYYSFPADGAVLDLGAGTGNFSRLLCDVLPRRKIIVADSNETMIGIARKKLTADAHRVSSLVCDAQYIVKQCREPVAATIMVHSLYAMRKKMDPDQPARVLKSVYDLLPRYGLFVVIDAGRMIDVLNWTIYALRHMYKSTGSINLTLRALLGNQEVLRQNRKVAKLQKQGEFYTHTLEELEDQVRNAGFTVLESSDHLYRGVDDMVVARKL